MAEEILSKVEADFDDLPDSWVILLETSAEKLIQVNTELTKKLTEAGNTVIMLSATRPHSNLMDLYSKSKVDTARVFVMCCICKSTGSYSDTANVFHVQDVSSLKEIDIILNGLMEEAKGGRNYVCLDSISSMLIHNEPKQLAMFLHTIMSKIRINNHLGILLSATDQTEKEIRAELAQLCDKVITF